MVSGAALAALKVLCLVVVGFARSRFTVHGSRFTVHGSRSRWSLFSRWKQSCSTRSTAKAAPELSSESWERWTVRRVE
jgi:hypothetical protein